MKARELFKESEWTLQFLRVQGARTGNPSDAEVVQWARTDIHWTVRG
jgi:hypothetical protein